MHTRQSLTLSSLAKSIDAQLVGDPELQIHGVATLKHATPGTLSFLSHKKYRRYLANTKATAVILTEQDATACPTAAIIHKNPYLAYAHTMRLLYPLKKKYSLAYIQVRLLTLQSSSIPQLG